MKYPLKALLTSLLLVSLPLRMFLDVLLGDSCGAAAVQSSPQGPKQGAIEGCVLRRTSPYVDKRNNTKIQFNYVLSDVSR